jgi:hypothetical protein
VVGTLRGLVGATGVPNQALLAALITAVGAARAAGSAAGEAPRGGPGAPAGFKRRPLALQLAAALP